VTDAMVNVRYMVDDVEAAIDFEIVTGPDGSQILIDDPSGNPIELFRPAR
jgi:hypothetical protein